MRRPVGDQNAVRLITVWVANAIAFAWAFLDFDPIDDNWESLFLLPLAIAVAAVVNGLVDPLSKERLVFLNWQNPFPATRAFSIDPDEKSPDLAKNDGRVDEKRLRKLERGALPDEPEPQYNFWFRCYVEVQYDPSVLFRRRDYMFARDYACTAAVIFFLASTTLLLLFMAALPTLIMPHSFSLLKHLGVQFSEIWIALISYTIFTAIQYAVLRYVAVRHGRQFVTTVLAVASTK